MRERNDTGLAEVAEAGQQYAAAYAAHYTTKDLREALRLYRGVMAAHPNTQEAGYSQSQIQNIVNAVVPRQELLDAQVDLALAHFDHEDQADLRRAQATPLASELTS
ncbi:MAG: hypothetical protein P8X82_18185 [Gemmatimonadales bacterium]|jgi:hypothetical protein